MRVTVAIPVYNEAPTVRALLARVAGADPGPGIEKEICVVDDGSTDGTAQLLRDASREIPMDLVLLPENRGKGSAIREALSRARGDLFLVQDADLEYDPRDYAALLEPFRDPGVSVVYGSRWTRPDSLSIPWNRFGLGTRLLTFLANRLYGSGITDEPVGYKVFRTGLLRSLRLRCQRFEFCPEVTAQLGLRRIRIHEVPIRYHPRGVREGKKIRVRDGVVAVWILLRHRLLRP
ncbi:MAG: glycosyltransferase family 2 protein [Planctomycetes bacterium]|nr:glycosyltransferase family 2 protein [Planctomycetota bacterium]